MFLKFSNYWTLRLEKLVFNWKLERQHFLIKNLGVALLTSETFQRKQSQVLYSYIWKSTRCEAQTSPFKQLLLISITIHCSVFPCYCSLFSRFSLPHSPGVPLPISNVSYALLSLAGSMHLSPLCSKQLMWRWQLWRKLPRCVDENDGWRKCRKHEQDVLRNTSSSHMWHHSCFIPFLCSIIIFSCRFPPKRSSICFTVGLNSLWYFESISGFISSLRRRHNWWNPCPRTANGISAQLDLVIDVFESMWGLDFLSHSCYLNNTCLCHGCLCELHSLIARPRRSLHHVPYYQHWSQMQSICWLFCGFWQVLYFSSAIPSPSTLSILVFALWQ